MFSFATLWQDTCGGDFQLCGLTKARDIFNTGWINVREILSFVAVKIWGISTTVWWVKLWLDKYRGHFQICGRKNVGGIFNSMAGQM